MLACSLSSALLNKRYIKEQNIKYFVTKIFSRKKVEVREDFIRSMS